MKKIIIILIFVSSILNAKSIIATYKISFGIFGRIGVATALFETKKDRTYHIYIKAVATGLAKLLTGGRVESYESSGEIVDGLLVPEIYEGETKTNSKDRRKVYIFDHKNQKIKILKFTIRGNKKTKSEEILKYYAKNDILSLFFNIKHYQNNFKFKGKKILYAAGANKKDGKVNLIAPTGIKLKKLKEDIGKKIGHFLIVFINQKIFTSKRGELFIDLNDNGICTKAVLKDVILFGDIRGELTKLKYE